MRVQIGETGHLADGKIGYRSTGVKETLVNDENSYAVAVLFRGVDR